MVNFPLCLLFVVMVFPCFASAQQVGESTSVDINNPLSVLEQASRVLPTQFAAPEQRAQLSTTLSIVVLLTVLTLAPAIVVLTTSFTRIVVTLALLRQAMGTQQLPPSQVLVGLSLFLTLLVMAPTIQRINTESIGPMQDGQINQLEAWSLAKEPLRDFMFTQIEYAGNWEGLYMILNYRGVDTSAPEDLTEDDVDMLALVPSFILSELKVAFLMGFRLYLPFLIIDMVVASVLISMGMLMLPPPLISLPFKLMLFVLADGWMLVAGSVLKSFAT